MLFLRKSIADCKIVIPENAHIVEKTAADELLKYIEKSLSVKLSAGIKCVRRFRRIRAGKGLRVPFSLRALFHAHSSR